MNPPSNTNNNEVLIFTDKIDIDTVTTTPPKDSWIKRWLKWLGYSK